MMTSSGEVGVAGREEEEGEVAASGWGEETMGVGLLGVQVEEGLPEVQGVEKVGDSRGGPILF